MRRSPLSTTHKMVQALFLAALLGGTISAWAQGTTRDANWGRCNDPEPDISIGGCTAVIQAAGEETVEGLSRAFMQRGEAYRGKKDYNQALTDLTKAIQLNPKNADAYKWRSYTNVERGDYQSVTTDADRSFNLNPDYHVYLGLCNVFEEVREWKRAIAQMDRVLQLAQTGSLYQKRAVVYQDAGDYAAAIPSWTQAIQAEPTPERFYRRAQAYLRVGDNTHAIADATEALHLKPGYDSAFRVLGDAYASEQDYERAVQSYDQALIADPNFYLAHLLRGFALLNLGRWDAAEADMAAAVKVSEGGPTEDVLGLYLVRVRAGRDGRQDLEAYVATHGMTAWPMPLAALYLDQTTPAAALTAASRPDPNADPNEMQRRKGEALFYIGEYALLKNDRAEAIRLLRESLESSYPGTAPYIGAQGELKRLQSPPLLIAKAAPAPEMRGMNRPAAAVADSKPIGKYYALVIGIDNYAAPLHALKTAVRDATAVAQDLRNLYGFDVTVLLNEQATRNGIIKAIRSYKVLLGTNDNLLIYYAGHGFQNKDVDKAYWLPVDADGVDSPNSIIADELTTDVRDLAALHVLVISDSCYSGGLTRDVDAEPPAMEQRAYLGKMLSGRSRTLMASGGDEPVSDNGTDGHSVFAYALLRALEQPNPQVFTASDLFYHSIRQRVSGNSAQTPEYQFIKNSGHDNGDFVFVRKP